MARRCSPGVLIFFLPLAGPAGADAATLLLRALKPDGTPRARATVVLDSDGGARSRVTGEGGWAAFTTLPGGRYRLRVEAPGFLPARDERYLAASEVVSLVATLARVSDAAVSEVRLVDRHPTGSGTSFDSDRLRDLPSSGTVWSLPETAETATITDRIENGGLYAGAPAFLGAHGSSFTQTSFRLGEMDVTDPDHTGTPLLNLDVGALEAVEVETALLPADHGPPGPVVTLFPRRPGDTWGGSAQAGFSTAGLQSGRAATGVPAIARFGSFASGQASAGGPVVRDRLRLLAAASWTRSRRLEPGRETALEERLASLLAQVVATPTGRDALRLVATGQSVSLPYAGRARFLDPDVRESDSFFQLEAGWERRGPGPAWSVAAGYGKGVFDPDISPAAAGRPVDRVTDGPIPRLVEPARRRSDRLSLITRVQPDLHGFDGGRHALVAGLTFSHATSVTRPAGGPSIIPELVDGLPARVWDYGYPGPESRRRLRELAGYVADRFALSPRLTADVGLRFELAEASAENAAQGVRWTTLPPRASARWRAVGAGRLSFLAGYARYYGEHQRGCTQRA